ncbi:LysR substrate-binding domain-containing protein [Epibacterium ulvae]|uniref:LysR substrate-binding domain-containing protein n=1 Tax=Epibacterium ulvae TaxID=1156985 RepID=UPI002490A1DA|nr:LysR substrate-binding domain-containing protein [Epibacterium ulvae]
MYRLIRFDIVTREIAEQPLAIYASTDLSEYLGQPTCFEDLAALTFVGFDQSDVITRTMRNLGFRVNRQSFGVRRDNQATDWELVRTGCGADAIQRAVADGDPKIRRLEFQPELPSLQIGLTAHEHMYRTQKIKQVWIYIAKRLKQKFVQSEI